MGAVPEHEPRLQRRRRLTLADVPLPCCPDWLGVDRALGAWGAWQRQQRSAGNPKTGLLLADAGTVLSLTLLDAKGRFQGGQLVPGLQLQLAAMAAGTNALQCPVFGSDPPLFPKDTGEAMLRGALQAMVGTVREAQIQSGATLWICGGDAGALSQGLLTHDRDGVGSSAVVDEDLVLKGMVNLIETVRPNRDP